MAAFQNQWLADLQMHQGEATQQQHRGLAELASHHQTWQQNLIKMQQGLAQAEAIRKQSEAQEWAEAKHAVARLQEFMAHRHQMKALREEFKPSAQSVEAPYMAAHPLQKTSQSNGHVTLLAQSTPAVRVIKPASAMVTPASEVGGDLSPEDAVRNYLELHQNGARLIEIESSLGINRFQAIDALRSLITQDLVTQRDRTYYIREKEMML